LRQSTKISRAFSLALIVFLLLLPAISAASAVVAEVGVDVEGGDRAKARSKAIKGALSEAVSTVVKRHVDASSFASRRREISRAFFANPNSYISRFVVPYEEVRRGRLKLSIEAEVDDLRVQSELERMGFAISKLHAFPRLSLYKMDGVRSSSAFERVAERFRQEGFKVYAEAAPVDPYLIFQVNGEEDEGSKDATKGEALKNTAAAEPSKKDESIVNIEFIEPLKGLDELDGPLTAMREEALAKGSNIIAILAADPARFDVDQENLDGAGGDDKPGLEGKEPAEKNSEGKPFGFSWSFDKQKDAEKAGANAPRLKEFSFGDASFEEIMEEIEAGPTYEALVEGHLWLVDVVSGSLLGEADVSYTGEAAAPEIADAKGSEGVGERLFQEGLSLITKSGWMPGPEKYQLKLKVTGINSPLLVERIEAELDSLAEFERVDLRLVESGAATWAIEALDSGLPLGAILSSVDISGGVLSWQPENQTTIETPPREEELSSPAIEVLGVWTPR